MADKNVWDIFTVISLQDKVSSSDKYLYVYSKVSLRALTYIREFLHFLKQNVIPLFCNNVCQQTRLGLFFASHCDAMCSFKSARRDYKRQKAELSTPRSGKVQ